MEQRIYITDEERQKCRRVADAFAVSKHEDADIVVADTGRYGFVRLSHFNELYGFERAICYTDSRELFNALWNDWLNEQLFQIALKNPLLMDLEYEEILRALPEPEQKELMRRQDYFKQKSGITNA